MWRSMRSLMFRSILCAAVVTTVAALGTPAFAQSTPPASAASSGNHRVGVAVRVSSLGVGGDIGLRLNRHATIRAGMNAFSLSRDFDTDENITFTGKVSLKSLHAFVDWSPFGGGFHLSPGLVFANSNKVTLNATIPGGKQFSIDDTDYVSSAANPTKAAGAVTVEQVKPALTLGWGNLVPQSHRISVPFEIGVVFQGTPTATLSFTGFACSTNGTNCRDVTTDATIQNKVRNQQAQLNDDIKIIKFYPVLSFGLGIRF